jgi:pyruvate carboxylase subunit B
MHPKQYEDYKSGKAKADFEADIAERELAASAPAQSGAAPAVQPTSMVVDVNGEKFKVSISYDGQAATSAATSSVQSAAPAASSNGQTKEILAPLEGTVFMTKDPSEKPLKVGDKVSVGDIVCYIEAMKVSNAVKSDVEGTVVEILIKNSDAVLDDDVMIRLN